MYCRDVACYGAYPIDGGQSSSCIFFEPMSENECRGEPCVRPRTKTGIEPKPEGERFIYILDHRFDTGFCSRANTRFAPTFDLDHRFDSSFCFPHPLDTPHATSLHDLIFLDDHEK
jgi:hypothetical protein